MLSHLLSPTAQGLGAHEKVLADGNQALVADELKQARPEGFQLVMVLKPKLKIVHARVERMTLEDRLSAWLAVRKPSPS